jgi:thiol-disulfide isomerase/thioredoxin
VKYFAFISTLLGLAFILSSCAGAQEDSMNAPGSQSTATVVASKTPEWFDMELTDVQTGKTFTMNDYNGKVILLETMAIWCPNCLMQAGAVQKLHEALGNPEDLISVSLDVDSNEDSALLKEYASQYGLDWHLAVAPLLVERALGNLYSAEYLNPPLSPMLIIDREGNVHQLEYGIKDVETLQKAVEPYLTK